MVRTINAKELRRSLREIVRRVRGGEHYLVLYRNRPAFRLLPSSDDLEGAILEPLSEEPLHGAPALGVSKDGATGADHDDILYGKHRR